MKQILNKHRIQLLILILVFVPVMLISLVPVKYTLVSPGYNNSVAKFITIEDAYQMDGSLHTTSVIVLEEMRALQYLIGRYISTADINEQPSYYSDIDLDDLKVQGYLAKDDSVARSLVVGIEAAGYDITYTTQNVVTMTYSYLDKNTLELGDVVLDINGNPSIIEEANSIECGNSATFSILRDGEPLSITATKHQVDDETCAFGLNISGFTDILETEINYEIHDNNTGGSSGGLMQSLYIFNQLTPHDITGGYKVAGTGTIDIDGQVGSIGGIRQKIITSVINQVDIFFVPHLSDEDYDNYIVALQVLEELDSDMILVPVSTFAEARAYLEHRFGGAFSE